MQGSLIQVAIVQAIAVRLCPFVDYGKSPLDHQAAPRGPNKQPLMRCTLIKKLRHTGKRSFL